MRVIDDQGRLFGIINVIDLLAVLFALAVVVAGVAVVFSGGSSEPSDLGTRYVTLDLGTQPAYVTERIDAGDVSTSNGPENLTITDVYVTPSEDGSSAVTVRARVRGQLQGSNDGRSTLSFAGNTLILGRELSLETDEYRASGTVTAIERADESLDVSTTDVVMLFTLPADVAADLSVGDRYRANGRNLATIESKTVYPANNNYNRRVLLGLSMQTISQQGRPQFGGRTVRPGNEFTLVFEPYDITGTVRDRGRTSLRGDVTTTTVVMELSDVPPERAANVRAGLTETVGDTQYAEITDVRSEPSEVVLTSDDGNISLHEHPRNVDVYVTVELRTRETANGLTFHGQPLRLNDPIELDLRFVTVRGPVIELRRS